MSRYAIGILVLQAMLIGSSYAQQVVGSNASAVTAAAATSQTDINKAINRGLDWLITIQKEDGSWSNNGFPALTALPMQAFIVSDHPRKKEVIDKALKFILSCVQKDGGIYKKSLIPGRGGLTSFNTAICMTAFQKLGDPAHVEILQNARKFVASSQISGDSADDGGFGYNKGGWFNSADMMNTVYALEAMRVTEKVEDLRTNAAQKVELRWDATVKFLERVQNKEDAGGEDAGGLFYKPGKSMAGTTNVGGKVVFRSYGTMTYVGLLSMVYANLSKDDPRVLSALDWASKHWSIEENPGLGKEGMYFFYHVLARALAACGVDKITLKDGSSIEWKPLVLAKILGLQKGNGAWINDNGRYWEADPVLVTSYSIIAIEQIMPKK